MRGRRGAVEQAQRPFDGQVVPAVDHQLASRERGGVVQAVLHLRGLEGLDAENVALIKSERDKQAAAGIQPIDLGADAGKAFLAKANEVGWASVIKRSPENGAKLRQLAGN